MTLRGVCAFTLRALGVQSESPRDVPEAHGSSELKATGPRAGGMSALLPGVRLLGQSSVSAPLCLPSPETLPPSQPPALTVTGPWQPLVSNPSGM